MVKYTSTVLAAAFAVAHAAPVDQPVCKVVTTVYSGQPIWVPNLDPTTAWGQWATTTSKTPTVSTTDPVTWSEWSTSSSNGPSATPCPPALSSYIITPCWTVEGKSTCTVVVKTSTITDCKASFTSTSSSKPVVPTTSASASVPNWSAWTSSAAATTTTKSSQSVVTTTSSKASTSAQTTSTTTSKYETTTSSKPVYTTTSTSTPSASSRATTSSSSAHITTTTSASTTANTTTSTTAAPKATCPASSGSNILGGGSCQCSFSVNCGVRSQPTADSKFWERNSDETIESLAECLAICDDNSECTAAIWTDDSTASSSDFKRCWQTSGLPQPSLQGYGQLSYKGSCSGSCSSDYNGGQ